MTGQSLSATSQCGSFQSGHSQFSCLASDGPGSAKGCSSLLQISSSGKLVSLPSGVCGTLKKMRSTVVLPDANLDMSLRYIASRQSCDVHRPRSTSSARRYNFNMNEMYNIPSCSASSASFVIGTQSILTILLYQLFLCSVF